MLIQFSVQNFLSFDEEQVFSLRATSSDQHHPDHIVSDAHRSGPVLRASAIYGPNASGKSNLVEAMRFAQQLITNGTRPRQPIAVRPFKLRAESGREASKFEFVFLTKGVLYNYGFRVDRKSVFEEWLYETLGRKETVIFERTTSADGKAKVEMGEKLRHFDKNGDQFVQFVAQGTRQTQLFLTELSERNVDTIKPAFNWFATSLMIIPAEPIVIMEAQARLGAPFLEPLAQFMRAAGTGIAGCAVEEVEFDPDLLFPDMPKDIRGNLDALQANSIIELGTADGSRLVIAPREGGGLSRLILNMQHQGDNGQLVPFDMDEESDGTRRLVDLFPALAMAKSRRDHTILIDELDRRFHPHLSRLVVQLAMDTGGEPSTTQFLFTTHDTNLLDLDLLRRDEIWFVEKDPRGASHVYSLAEFKIRPDLKIQKGYLNGRFGAIPFISDVDTLGWNLKGDPELDAATS